MHTLRISFALLTYSGFWRPIGWSSRSLKYWLYNAFTAIMIFLLHGFTFCGLVDLFVNVGLDNFIEKFSLLITILGICCKMLNIVLRRDKIIDLTNMLLEKNCVPRDKNEKVIQKKFVRNARIITIWCEVLNEITALFATLGQLTDFLKSRYAMINHAFPTIAIKAILIYQSFGSAGVLMICANASVANDTLIAGLMIQICAQLEIITYRMRRLPEFLRNVQNYDFLETKILTGLIQHHLHIYEFAKKVNSTFTMMIFIQFSISSVVLCMTVYKISTKSVMSVDFLWSSFYFACMLMQIFLYCWCGNEVTLKSIQVAEAIYEMDWTQLRKNIIKDLLVVMLRATKPIMMTSGHIVILSIDSFMGILKVSYSTYNVLKESSN